MMGESDERVAPLAIDAQTFRTLGHQLVDQLAAFLESVPRRPVTRDESPSQVREALGLTGPLPESGTDPALLARADGAAPLRSLAAERPPAVLRLHHGAAGADRHPRRLPGRGREPERRRLDAVAGRDRDRVADRAVDCLAHRLPGRLRRTAGQRRQHGELRVLPGRAVRRRAARRCASRVVGGSGMQAARLRLGRNPHLDPEGRRSRRPRHRGDPVDPDGRRVCGWMWRHCAAISRTDTAAGDVPCIVVGTAGSVSTGAVDPLREIARGLPASMAPGSTSTAPTAASPPRCRKRPTTCAV